MGNIKMKIVTFTLFAIIATILASLRSKRSKNKDAAQEKAACAKACYGTKAQNYAIPLLGKSMCVCRNGDQITNFFRWAKRAGKFVQADLTNSDIKRFIAMKVMTPMN